MVGETQVVQPMQTLRSPRRLADLLHRRHQHADQNPDNGNYHQQLNECKSAPVLAHVSDLNS